MGMKKKGILEKTHKLNYRLSKEKDKHQLNPSSIQRGSFIAKKEITSKGNTIFSFLFFWGVGFSPELERDE